jgi:hypothetical protein
MPPELQETLDRGAHARPPFRWTDICPVCGYSLNGLPDVGVCPECGEKYDTSEIILYGWPCGSHASPLNDFGSGVLLILVLGAIGGFLWSWGITYVRVVVIPPTVVVGVLIISRWIRDRRGTVQVRLTNRGAVQYDDLKPSYQWLLLLSHILMMGVLAPVAIFVLYFHGAIYADDARACSIWAAIWAVVGWGVGWRLRQKLADFRRSESRDLNAFLKRPCPWRELRLAEWWCSRPGLYVLRLNRCGWWTWVARRVKNSSPVHAKLKCGDEKGAWLGETMQKWISDAQKSAK